jgi:hypothetical protein
LLDVPAFPSVAAPGQGSAVARPVGDLIVDPTRALLGAATILPR